MGKQQRFRKESPEAEATAAVFEKTATVEDFIRGLKGSERFAGRVVHVSQSPVQPAKWAKKGAGISSALEASLRAVNISRLYRHQLDAVEKIRAGRHVVVCTPTASGKTLIYTLPLLERLIESPGHTALYLSPLKALAQDQLRKLKKAASSVPDLVFTASIYDGDTKGSIRKKIRELPPQVLLTNPEMLHLSFLAHHRAWASFFRRLSLVVVDEVHTYRGVMGSHMAQVFRRMLRVCARYEAAPTFVFTSATVANPAELVDQLTGIDAEVIFKSGAGRGRAYTALVDAADGPAQAAILLLKAALYRGLRTIVYVRSRKMAELISVWSKERAGRFAEKIAAYRAGYLPEERRSIEAKLADGRLLAVVTTSALELGIDIGDLDLCILVGYPGSIVATRQRAGRVGRSGQASAVVLLAGEDALDQYLLRHPDTILEHPPEPAVVNPENPDIVKKHLLCAAAELPLDREENWMKRPEVARAAAELEQHGELLRAEDGKTLYARRRAPHRQVDLRGSGSRYAIVEAGSGAVLGEIDEPRAFRETHPGAVYLHGGETFVVKGLDTAARTVTAAPEQVEHYTRVRAEKEIEVLETIRQKTVFHTRVCFGRLKVTDQVTGYETWSIRTRQRLGRFSLDLPPVVFETEGLWFSPEKPDDSALSGGGLDWVGALHAAEHGIIGIFPLVVMADRDDLGGLATPFHPAAGGAGVFIYDGIAGGAGLCRAAFERAEALFRHALDGIASCGCKQGCPACIQSSRCGSGNRPLDKAGAVLLLKMILDDAGAKLPEPKTGNVSALHSRPNRRKRLGPQRQSAGFAVLDLETRRSAAEVGGWHLADRMGVSCAVLYDSTENRFLEYFEEQLPEMFDRLDRFDRIVGFNVKRFDYRVLSAYTGRDFDKVPTVDLLEVVHQVLGFRLSLDHLAGATLGRKKTAGGLQALQWWKEGRIAELLAYCRRDVEITRDLYVFGRENGYVLFDDREGRRMRVPVSW